MITVEELHLAAATVATLDAFPENAQVVEFIEGSVFHPPMDQASLAYGICIGIIAMRDNNDDKEQQ